MAEWENLSIKLGVNNMASLKCSQCGLEGRYCKLESNGRGPHFNVYGIDEERKRGNAY